MTPTHLTILRTIAERQPVLKDDLLRILSIARRSDGHYRILFDLKEQGYIEYDRHKGPVWLTVKGREIIDTVA